MVKAQSQNSGPSPLTLNGYIKDLRTYIPAGTNGLLVDNLLHNRLNFKWYAAEPLTLVAEARNRVFYGEVVGLTPSFGTLVNDANNDVFDLSHNLFDKKALVVNVMLDRAYIDFTKDKWEVRLGRQRINWGINTIWNPNDWFNAYSFFDFDYEERPGSDALRIQYYTGYASSMEVAVKAADSLADMVGAGLWRFNRWNYDIQFLAGVMRTDLALGSGWAGNLGNAGFKGELAYFHPYRSPLDTSGVFSGTFGVDYAFKNSLYLSGAFLYNSLGITDPLPLNDPASGVAANTIASAFQLSPKSLSPFKYSFFTQAMYPISPIVNAGLAIIYSTAGHTMFINPLLGISLNDNLDLALVGQSFFTTTLSDAYIGGSVFFSRLKWSF